MLNSLFSTKKAAPYRYGIALGGGGARGFAHLGALKALNEAGIKPEVISGVSAGAIAGAFIAGGFSPDEVFGIMKENRLGNFTSIQIPRDGLLNFDKLRHTIARYIPAKNIEDLPIPFYVAASNLNEGRVEYFHRGDLGKIVQASASIPVLFSPVKIDGKKYVDGGIFDNVPIAPIKEQCETTIAINISPTQRVDKLNNLIDIATRTFHLSVDATSCRKKEECDIYIEPPELYNYPILDASRAEQMFFIGYEYTKTLRIQPSE
ncbi:patatin-like phospholipase family protein [Sinomicrobium soli]|uniref:patatin-like phospholipase family protein n=1 Tax=Sinomicrobium sp. N-1-3-6 TaxID=2219864 RepID=UPI000DCD6100|nr:patatin-like phospholipase family protein [Sinomicrobium sp. N-1-3-6]RAV29796.1 patatin [Sinomicrobium sp. N-1-3-6]